MNGRLPVAISAPSPWPSSTHHRSPNRCRLRTWSRQPSGHADWNHRAKSPHLTGHDQNHPEYKRMHKRMWTLAKVGRKQEAKGLRRTLQRLPARDPLDPDYRRLRYVRYADDWLLGFCGPRVEAEAIKSQLGAFLREELKLDLSEPKTLITHARSQAAHFLGY